MNFQPLESSYIIVINIRQPRSEMQSRNVINQKITKNKKKHEPRKLNQCRYTLKKVL